MLLTFAVPVTFNVDEVNVVDVDKDETVIFVHVTSPVDMLPKFANPTTVIDNADKVPPIDMLLADVPLIFPVAVMLVTYTFVLKIKPVSVNDVALTLPPTVMLLPPLPV